MTRKALYLLPAVVFLLACGAPAYIAPEIPTPTQQVANTASPTPQKTAVVLVSLTVRDAPCESSRALEYLSAGDAIEIVGNPVVCHEDGGSWVEININQPVRGWVNRRYIEER